MSSPQEEPAATEEEGPAPILLTEPADGVPDIVTTAEQLHGVIEAFKTGKGPIAADAERASGFRYGQATYLVQFKRAGAGIALIDAAALPDLSAFHEAMGDAEYVFHAASQDLPGVKDLGIHPSAIFDTELAARLLGWPKVGLAAVVERELGFALAKEHSAQDWSVRPLPDSWLAYAALDVEILLELRDGLAGHLEAAGKSEWARQEFEAVRLAPPAEPRIDPWRRTSGTHTVRDQRGLAIVRALWEEREREAQRRDVTPGRVLRDAAIIAAASSKPASLEALLDIPEWRTRGTKKAAPRWWPAIEAALALSEKALPARRAPAGDGPPPPRAWPDKRPEAAARLTEAKLALAALAERHDVPVENLLQPDAARRACWEYRDGGVQWVRDFLTSRSARPWQIDLTAQPLAEAFMRAAVLDADQRSGTSEG
ncbi:HRDC domain-containing protein [Demequina sp. TTPB684]|uniref:HRDC domain-containing protein n=1 Tax=unclassified Demequina TaxID=2620311 RepID=UPI001CF535B8|nr:MULTISPECIES: HRDC domain-containing protein [unclassified Demequina]MCB2414102.1 HRDC domain-containing protein [Demequina sp. TTPB684]UPU89187.1 HRDC domain-containing protein [Demequina sp. TMPB413]